MGSNLTSLGLPTKTNQGKLQNRKLAAYGFILPAVIFILTFVLYPIIYNISISFHEVNVFTLNGEKAFAGLTNYMAILKMPVFKTALFNTFYFTVMCIIFQFGIGFGLALFFSKRFPGNSYTRGLLLVCWILPTIVTGIIWKWILAGDMSGILNYILSLMGIIDKPVLWLTTIKMAMWSVIMTNIWVGIPFNMLLLTTGLITLPGDVYEAAAIDGASRMQRFILITLPLMKPIIMTVITLGFINTFKQFDLIYIMTQGGPVDATELLSTMSYRLTFSNFDFGQGAATANALFAILMIIGCIYLKFTSKGEGMS